MSAENTGPLAGLRVVEMGQLIAGPFCGQLLGDMGADVIKLEPPGTGDPMPFNLREVRELAERQAILRALSSCGNNVAQAARLLGVTRPTLYNLIAKFHINLVS